MSEIVNMRDVQNYFLSFFAGLGHPLGETAEEIENEVKEDER